MTELAFNDPAAMTEISTPYELMAQIERDARDLDNGGRQLARAIISQSAAELNYQREFEKQLIVIRDRYRESGERMPGEEMRRAIAHQQVDKAVYARYLSETAKVEALKAWTRIVASALSGRQSLLAVQRAELQATST